MVSPYRNCMKVKELRLHLGEEITGMYVLEKITYTENVSTRWQALTLKDKTGRVYGKIWAEQMRTDYQNLEGKVVNVIGRVEMFRDTCELRIVRMQEVADDKVDPCDFYDSLTEYELNELIVEIGNILRDEVTDRGVQALISYAFKSERLEKLKMLPAVGRMHHDYRGGLLEHAVETFRIAASLSTSMGCRFQKMDMNILAAGALLCDIGALNHFEQPVGKYDSPWVGEHGRMLPIHADSLILIGCFATKLPPDCRLQAHTLTRILEVIMGMQRGGCPSTKEGIVLQHAKELSASCSAFDQSFIMTDSSAEQKNEIHSPYFERTIRRFREEERA